MPATHRDIPEETFAMMVVGCCDSLEALHDASASMASRGTGPSTRKYVDADNAAARAIPWVP
jgi:hypothetical protein